MVIGNSIFTCDSHSITLNKQHPCFNSLFELSLEYRPENPLRDPVGKCAISSILPVRRSGPNRTKQSPPN